MTLGHNICQQGDNICLDYIDTFQPVAIPSATMAITSASHKVPIPSATINKSSAVTCGFSISYIGQKHEPIQKTNYLSILQKAMIGMNSEAQFQCNKLLKLDNTMLMYGINNAETLEKLINTVKELHNVTSSHEKSFAGEHNPSLFRILYMNALGVQQYAFNSLLFLRIVQDKYVSLYKEHN